MKLSVKRMFTRFKTLIVQSRERRTAASSEVLPLVAFLALPIYVCTVHFVVLFATVFMFDREPPILMKLCGIISYLTLFIFPVVWLVCLVMFFVPGLGKRDIYCWLPLMAFGVHVLCVAALWFCAFTQI